MAKTKLFINLMCYTFNIATIINFNFADNLCLGKSLKVLMEERDTKERQRSRQTTKRVEVRWDRNNEDGILLLSTTSEV